MNKSITGCAQRNKKSKEHPQWERFRKHKLAMTGLIMLSLMVLIVIFVPILLGLDATTSDYASLNHVPSERYILGTDNLGRDMMARTLFGGRISLLVGLLSVVVSALIGVPLGLLAGYYEKTVGRFVLRIADIFISFPMMILMLVVVSFVSPSVVILVLVIGVISWPEYTRLVYSNTLSVRQKDYVEAARASGVKTMSMMSRYVLPNAISPVWITLTFGVGRAIITEATLSFLGVGVQTPNPSWGNIIREALGLTVLTSRPWIWLPSGLLLIITVVCVNFIGDGVRDALDPQTRL